MMPRPITMTLDPTTGRWRAPCGCEVKVADGLTDWKRDWRVTLHPCAAHEARRRLGAVPVTDARAREARNSDL